MFVYNVCACMLVCFVKIYHTFLVTVTIAKGL